jgi:hypothetical protein
MKHAVLGYDWLITFEIFRFIGLLTTVSIQNWTQTSLVDYFYRAESCNYSCVADTLLLCCSVICKRCLLFKDIACSWTLWWS